MFFLFFLSFFLFVFSSLFFLLFSFICKQAPPDYALIVAIVVISTMCCIITVAVGVYVYKHREHHEKEHVKTVELHRDWRVMQTMSKRMYYFNPETGETSWTPPSNAKVVEAPNAVTDGEGHYLPPGWHEGEHEGEIFYFHDDGESTSWEVPDWIPHGWTADDSNLQSASKGHNRTATTHVVDSNEHTWVVAEAEAGQKYYFNEATETSSWHKPEGMSIYGDFGADDGAGNNGDVAVAMEINPMRH